MKIAKIGIAAAAALLAGACSNGADDAADAPPAETPAPEPVSAEAEVPEAAVETTEVAAVSEPPTAFAQCKSCHAVEPDKHGIGPSLFGVAGTKAASAEGFNYSEALKESAITWDRASLDTWLEAPIKMVPGARMVIGVPNEEARSAIIDYLETLK